ncbi:IclR family transcriptional regulator [Agrococcus jejuensis]|uniref:IclR family transcriptional regulator n=1 Tax=Agrococcus jejuensis TaxID=399736 RepID=UPI0011A32866|nr:IclR family transcriptional regulator [Agrococcus jejuensis]
MPDDDVDQAPEARAGREPGVQTVEKTLAILEIVAERGGATAKDVSAALGFPLPTTYRLLQVLVQRDYLVHLRDEHRFELGYRLDRLSASLHRQVGVPHPVRSEVARLHDLTGAAAYFAVYRGADVIVAHVVDCPDHPRITPLRFGFHEAAHATAFGKIMLAGMAPEAVEQYIDVHPMTPLTSATMTRRDALVEHLDTVATRGVAWEQDEFVPGMTCAAVGVRDRSGAIVGAVAVSAPSRTVDARRQRDLERHLRDVANQVSRCCRSGQPRDAAA